MSAKKQQQQQQQAQQQRQQQQADMCFEQADGAYRWVCQTNWQHCQQRQRQLP
jgi:hypothetical protein